MVHGRHSSKGSFREIRPDDWQNGRLYFHSGMIHTRTRVVLLQVCGSKPLASSLHNTFPDSRYVYCLIFSSLLRVTFGLPQRTFADILMHLLVDAQHNFARSSHESGDCPLHDGMRPVWGAGSRHSLCATMSPDSRKSSSDKLLWCWDKQRGPFDFAHSRCDKI